MKLMAKLGENLLRSTKIYRFFDYRQRARLPPKPKWNSFLSNPKNQEEYKAWQQWWASPQSARWKNIEGAARWKKETAAATPESDGGGH